MSAGCFFCSLKIKKAAFNESGRLLFNSGASTGYFDMSSETGCTSLSCCSPDKCLSSIYSPRGHSVNIVFIRVASGIAKYYKPEELVGKKIILVANLKPAVLCGVESQGMILAGENGDDVKVIFVDGLPAGSKIR